MNFRDHKIRNLRDPRVVCIWVVLAAAIAWGAAPGSAVVFADERKNPSPAPTETPEQSPFRPSTDLSETGKKKPEKETKTQNRSTRKSGVKWKDYEEGLALAEERDKAVFLNFYADWCRICKMMDQTTFRNNAVVIYLNDNFVSVKVDSEKRTGLARQYGVQALPSTFFVATDGETIQSPPGYLAAEELLPILQYVHTKSYLKMSYLQFLETL